MAEYILSVFFRDDFYLKLERNYRLLVSAYITKVVLFSRASAFLGKRLIKGGDKKK